jgi:hypothetical protein
MYNKQEEIVMGKIPSKEIINILTSAKNKIDAVKVDDRKKKDKKEIQFINRVDTVYKIASTGLTLALAITSLYIPPVSIAIASVLVAMSLIHYYDKKNNYELSHCVVNKLSDLFGKNKKTPRVVENKLEKPRRRVLSEDNRNPHHIKEIKIQEKTLLSKSMPNSFAFFKNNSFRRNRNQDPLLSERKINDMPSLKLSA